MWLAALAWGASSVAVLASDKMAPQYREALRFQMQLGDTIASLNGVRSLGRVEQNDFDLTVEARINDSGCI